VSCRDNCSSSVAMRRYDAGHIWRATANDLFVQNRLFCQQQCPPRNTSTRTGRIKYTKNDFSVAACHIMHIILANKCTNDTTRGRRPTQIAGTSRAIRRPYRLAFRPPTPLSDARDNGVSADHLIGRGDAAWTAIGDDTPP
jgi:hypothetical protein